MVDKLDRRLYTVSITIRNKRAKWKKELI
jgi:hypothetical protein